ncbi:hypothetical protein GCM10009823_20670 [Brevibacterium salitolerans]|jgi:uncharacterized membrane protein|uniref:DUF1648 domain-containing protein n=1 Tax=Brevibacterium salitolerans TaxID=1403566 RepID=A0ABP5IFH6_9MICO
MGVRLQHAVGWLGLAVFALAQVCIWFAGPDSVVSHVGAGGEPDAWMPKGRSVGVSFLIGAIIVAVILLCRLLVRVVPAGLVNIPSARAHRYWTSPEHRPEFNARMNAWLSMVGGAVLMGVACLNLELAFALPAGRPPFVAVHLGWVIPAVVLGCAAYLCLWLVRIPARRGA